MEHSQFVNYWKNGALNVSVNRQAALRIANSKILPKRYQYAHLFWCSVWILLIPTSFAVMYFYTWWAGLAILAFNSILSKAVKTSAMQFMIDYAIENPEFYHIALLSKVIILNPK